MKFSLFSLFILIQSLAWGSDSLAVQPLSAAPDSSLIDSTQVQDSLSLNMDGLNTVPADSLAVDSLTKDSLGVDSLALDSTVLPDSLAGLDSALVPTFGNLNNTVPKDSLYESPWSVVGELGYYFINFGDRYRMENEYDYELNILRQAADADSTSSGLEKAQEFEKVNFAFPVTLAFRYHPDTSYSLGVGMKYFGHTQEAILKDKDTNNIPIEYSLDAYTVFIEYRSLVSQELITLRNGVRFSYGIKYYWAMPFSHVAFSDKKIYSEFDPMGNGFSFHLGYTIRWFGRYQFNGELEYSRVNMQGEFPWSSILKSESGSSEKASWGVGGIGFHLSIQTFL